jgi:hypothetical protein
MSFSPFLGASHNIPLDHHPLPPLDDTFVGALPLAQLPEAYAA